MYRTVVYLVYFDQAEAATAFVVHTPAGDEDDEEGYKNNALASALDLFMRQYFDESDTHGQWALVAASQYVLWVRTGEELPPAQYNPLGRDATIQYGLTKIHPVESIEEVQQYIDTYSET